MLRDLKILRINFCPEGMGEKSHFTEKINTTPPIT